MQLACVVHELPVFFSTPSFSSFSLHRVPSGLKTRQRRQYRVLRTVHSPVQVKTRLWYLEFRLLNYLAGRYLRKSRLEVGHVVAEEQDVVGLDYAQTRILSTGHHQREDSRLPCLASG